jgi:dCMP deaminase
MYRQMFDYRWIENFFRHAELAANMSKDPKGQVGAVIVDHRKRIISSGFNGLPAGINFDLGSDGLSRADRLACTIHAETNAMAFAHVDLQGRTMFCTRHPCASCAAMIVQRGIRVLYYLDDYKDTINADWARSFELAQDMFTQGDVAVHRYGRNRDPSGVLYVDWPLYPGKNPEPDNSEG